MQSFSNNVSPAIQMHMTPFAMIRSPLNFLNPPKEIITPLLDMKATLDSNKFFLGDKMSCVSSHSNNDFLRMISNKGMRQTNFHAEPNEP